MLLRVPTARRALRPGFGAYPVRAWTASCANGRYHRPMSKLLLNLRNVPDDELEEVRAMLDEHRIEFYETQPSRWGISYGGVWVTDDKDIAEAKRLMADYQSRRQARVRAEYSQAKAEGSAETFMDVLREQPLRVLLTVVAVVVLLGLVALPAYLLRQ